MKRREFLALITGAGALAVSGITVKRDRMNRKVGIIATQYGYVNIIGDPHVRSKLTHADIRREIERAAKQGIAAFPVSIRVREHEWEELIESEEWKNVRKDLVHRTEPIIFQEEPWT